MTNPNSIDPSMLVLKMVGGNLDGKLLPISTQKCFLAGGKEESKEQCAIIRGPSGTAIKSGKQIFVNDHSDTLHWLNEGDTIRIGQTTMVVEQLGSFGQTSPEYTPTQVNDCPAAGENLHESALATDSESSLDSPTELNAPDLGQPNNTEFATPSHPASHIEEFAGPEPTEREQATQENSSSDGNQIDEILARLNSDQDQSTLSSETAPQSCTEETEMDPSEASLKQFLENSKTESAQPPADDTANGPSSDEAKDPRLNNELLERALQSLQQPVNEPAISPEELGDLSTEQNVDHQLDHLQNQIESQIQTYDSLPEPTETADTKAPENVACEDTASVHDLSEPREPGAIETVANQPIPSTDKSETVEEIMNRLNAANQSQPTAEMQPNSSVETTGATANRQSANDIPGFDLATEEAAPKQPSATDIINQLSAPTDPQPAEDLMDAATQLPTEASDAQRAFYADSSADDSAMDASGPIDSGVESAEIAETGASDMAVEPASAIPDIQDEGAVDYATLETQSDETPITGENSEIAPATPEEQNSVAQVLARMKSAGQLDEYNIPDEGEESESLETAQTAPKPELTNSIPTASPATPEESEGGDVQDYMNQLFQRLRGSDAPASVLPQPEVIEPEDSVQESEPVEEPVKEVERILTSTEYVPQQQAPEEKSDLEAMRQIANKQKSAAVQNSNTKKSQFEQTVCQFVALSGLVAAGALGWMATSLSDPLALASIVGGGVALIAGGRFLVLMKEGNDVKRSKSRTTKTPSANA